jgi:predicted sulfurtransferase
MTSEILNIAGYKFAEMSHLLDLRDELRGLTKSLDLRGTVLLSCEGINLFVAGSPAQVQVLLERLHRVPGLGDLTVKKSFSQDRPFNRMLVKIKKEIIAFGVDGIDPIRSSAPRLPAAELKRWLDEGRPVTLLDTRNNFEVKTGTFDQAVAIGVEDFRDFPRAAATLPAEMKHQPVVTFCTGGIRCEKAAPYLQRLGFTEVYQLDGGILKYFEECGQAHFHGHCFVFDKRVALNAELKQSGLQQCFVCQAILSVEEQSSADYVEGKSCPYCI